jgi:hypothetical protein
MKPMAVESTVCNVGQARAPAVARQYAGSALLRNEAVHTVLSGPRAVSSLVFCSRKARDV